MTWEVKARKRLYRYPEGGVFSGICRGLAVYTGLPVGAVRVLYVIAAVSTAWIPLFCAYIALHFVLPEAEGMGAVGAHAGDEGPLSPRAKQVRKRRAERSLRATEKRIARLEAYLISSEYEWERQYRG